MPVAAFSYPKSLGGAVLSPALVAAVARKPNRLDVFAVGQDFSLLHWSYNGQGWNRPTKRGGPSSPWGGLTAVSWGPSRIDVFGSKEGILLHWWWDDIRWHGPEELPGVGWGGIDAVCWGPNRIDVFGSGTRLQHLWWDGNQWGGPEFIRLHDIEGYPWQPGWTPEAGRPTAVSWGPGRLDVFAGKTRGNEKIYHWWYDAAENVWRLPDTHSVFTNGISSTYMRAVSWGPNRLDLFTHSIKPGGYYTPNHFWWGGAGWETSAVEGRDLKPPFSVVSMGPHRIDIVSMRVPELNEPVTTGWAGYLQHQRWDGMAWTETRREWTNLVPTSNIALVSWGMLRLDAFFVAQSGELYHCYHDR